MRADALERLLERSDAVPLGNRAALARIVALCDEASATPSGIALEAARDEGFAALLMRLANSAGIGVELAMDPTPSALGLAQVTSVVDAEARLEPLLAAQDRFDAFQG